MKEFRRCKTCKQTLSKENFTPWHQGVAPYSARCKDCVAGMNKSWYLRNKEHAKEYMRQYRQGVKDEVFDHYGKLCFCCGEEEYLFLDIDHIDNNGAEHRKVNKLTAGTQFYVWLRDNNFPDNFQVLCCNCNRGKYRNGGLCPHKEVINGKHH